MDIRSIGNMPLADAGMVERNTSAADAAIAALSSAAPVETSVAIGKSAAIPTLAEVSQAVKNINKAMENMAQGLEFSVDSDSHRTIVKVVDQQTKQVIRQIPTEQTMEIAKALDQAQGLLLKQKA